MTRKRAVGVIRLSKSADPVSTSMPRQQEIIEHFTEAENVTIVGWAIDKATSAFHVPPEKRKFLRVWLDQPEDFDCFIYWRQDRLVRRAYDFMGLVNWCQANHKALFSATEGLGDVTQHAGLLLGFINAWQAEGESRSQSARQKSSRPMLAKQGRYPGGRVAYGFHAVRKAGKAGWYLVPDEEPSFCSIATRQEYGTAEILRQAARRVIAGESIHYVIADFNRRKVPSADGGLWYPSVLKGILHNRVLLNGILTAAEWAELQSVLKSRKERKRWTKTKTENVLLDLVFCGKCGGKIYRIPYHVEAKNWHKVYGRCQNVVKRAQTATPCDMKAISFDMLQDLVTRDIRETYGEDLIQERVPRGSERKLRLDEIDSELLDLAERYAMKRLSRAEYRAEQSQLLDEQEALEAAQTDEDNTPVWRDTGETVRERWERLSPAERRLWLLRIGVTFTLYRDERPGAYRWRVVTSWREAGDAGQAAYRERFVRVGEAG